MFVIQCGSKEITDERPQPSTKYSPQRSHFFCWLLELKIYKDSKNLYLTSYMILVGFLKIETETAFDDRITAEDLWPKTVSDTVDSSSSS